MEVAKTHDLGKRLKALRDEQNLSLRELAKRSSLSVNALSLIERNKTSPTVATLTAVARALNISVVDFFSASDEGKTDLSVYRSSKAKRDKPMEVLASNLKSQNLNPVIITLKPGENFSDNLCVHGGDEFVYALSGEIDCDLGERQIVLKEGDAVTFKGELPHRLRNNSSEKSIAIVVCEGGPPA